MTEIVMDIISVGILHIEILISLGHRMILRYMGNYMDTICHLAGMICQNESVIVYIRPFRSDAMQITSFRKERTTHSIRRDDNLSFLILLQEIP